MSEATVAPRHSRSASILPPDKLGTVDVGIIGVGAIGRQVALQLAAAGQIIVTIYDHDTVEDVNLGPQGFMPDDIGKPKVTAVGDMMSRMNPEIDLEAHHRRFTTADTGHDVLFCCVDSIEVREHVWEHHGANTPVFIDGRMAAEVLRVITACDEASKEYYPSTLFGQHEAFEGACTARSTIFTSNIAAGMMVEQYSKWLRDMPMDRDIIFNLLAMDVIIP